MLGLTRRVSNARSASGGASLNGLPNKAINWFKDLSSIPKLVLVGLLLLLLFAILSPLLLVAAVVLLGVSLVALIVRIAKRRSIVGWGGIGVASLVSIFVFWFAANTLYHVGVTEEDSRYLNETERIQGGLEDLLYTQASAYNDYLAITYPSPTTENLSNSGNFSSEAQKYVESAQGLSVPDGCEDHYKIWLDGAENTEWFIIESGAAMYAGDEFDREDSPFNYVNIAMEEARQGFDRAGRSRRVIQVLGCS